MVLLVHKIGRSLKFPSKLDEHGTHSEALSACLRDFRSKISNFINQIMLKPEPGSAFMSLEMFNKCFELIHISNGAFAKMVVEIDYPMNKWGEKSREEYLNYSLDLLDLLNSINSSISHLIQAKLSVHHALSLIENSTSSASKYLKKMPRGSPGKIFNVVESTGVEEYKCNSEKERVVLDGLMVMKRTGNLALGLVLSGLCSDSKAYMEIRKFAAKSDDSMIKGLDSRFCEEVVKTRSVVVEVSEVNTAADRLCEAISVARYEEAVKELKRKLEVMENSVEGIEKKANTLFSEVLSTRNKVLDNIRLTGKHP